jgi:hypothetical protein
MVEIVRCLICMASVLDCLLGLEWLALLVEYGVIGSEIWEYPVASIGFAISVS